MDTRGINCTLSFLKISQITEVTRNTYRQSADLIHLAT